MSEALREQRPLLSEDLSEEERFPVYPRRYRPLYRGRAKSAVKGAAAIITRWPEHWSSTFTYCWIGFGMMALTVFAVYNVIISFAMLPAAHMTPANLRTNKLSVEINENLPEVFLHFIVNTNEGAAVDKYLPYVEIFSNKHLEYKFNMIFLFNDSAHTAQSAEENNEIALNSIWSKVNLFIPELKSHKNIKIRYMALSQFMDESPIRVDWRRIPTKFIEFLVQAISIWQKGGVAINPETMTPYALNTFIIEKFESILKDFKAQEEKESNKHKAKKITNKPLENINKKRVNNIRDVINELEHEGNNTMKFQVNLTEAENYNSPVVNRDGRKLLSFNLQTAKNYSNKIDLPSIVQVSKTSLLSSTNESENFDHLQQHYLSNINSRDETNALEVINDGFEILDESNEPKLGLLPLFFEFFFHDRPTISNKKQEENNLKRRQKITTIRKEINSKNNLSVAGSINNKSKSEVEKHKPITIPAKKIVPDQLLKDAEPKTKSLDILFIELKGNILATKASCHAFIGTLFNNIAHHSPEETLEYLIFSELSAFCKGHLFPCPGVRVILA